MRILRPAGLATTIGFLSRSARALMVLLLLAVATVAEAATVTVIFEDGGTKATRVENLEVDGALYNATFDPQQFALEQFGPFPGTFFPFTTLPQALNALDAMIVALNDAGATTIGESGGPSFSSFTIGYDSFLTGDIQSVSYTRSLNQDPGDLWENFGENDNLYIGQELNWAVFEPVPVPAAVWLFGSALGLLGWLRRMKKPNPPI